MKQIRGNLFNQECDAFCVTTNGFVKNNGEAVMGKGCAKTLAEYFPRVPLLLGHEIDRKGNRVNRIMVHEGREILSFPVKPARSKIRKSSEVVKHMQSQFRAGSNVPGWACVADIQIIARSALELVEMADQYGWEKVVIPRPGTGHGELSWEDVCPVLEEILDDRFYIITF